MGGGGGQNFLELGRNQKKFSLIFVIRFLKNRSRLHLDQAAIGNRGSFKC